MRQKHFICLVLPIAVAFSILFSSANISSAAECASATVGGTCVTPTGTSCPTDKPQSVAGTCATSGQICCKASTTTTAPKVYIPSGSEVGLPDPSGGIAAILKSVLSWMLGIIGMIALIAFVISGIQYLTSHGDEKQIATAKLTMTYAAIGIIAALSGFIVIQAIDLALRATSNF